MKEKILEKYDVYETTDYSLEKKVITVTADGELVSNHSEMKGWADPADGQKPRVEGVPTM